MAPTSEPPIPHLRHLKWPPRVAPIFRRRQHRRAADTPSAASLTDCTPLPATPPPIPHSAYAHMKESHSHHSARMSTHTASPLPSASAHTPGHTACGRRVSAYAQRNRRPRKQARSFPLDQLFASRCGCRSSPTGGGFIHFIHSDDQNVGIRLRLENSCIWCHVTVSGRNLWATTSDNAKPSRFWAGHVRCPAGKFHRCQTRFRREHVGCGPLLSYCQE